MTAATSWAWATEARASHAAPRAIVVAANVRQAQESGARGDAGGEGVGGGGQVGADGGDSTSVGGGGRRRR